MPAVVVGLVILMSFSNAAIAQPSLDAGKRAYDVCAGCHGFLGEGNALVSAPSLAGLEPWYVERQIRNFSAGIRGGADGDVHGQRMATMAGAVVSDRELADLIAYIASLPDARAPTSVAGDAGNGQQAYAVCAACHGLDGGGNETLSAPALIALDDWYVVEQLRLYAEGLRGAHPQDIYGQQMRSIAGTFADDEVRRDLAAYIDSLAH